MIKNYQWSKNAKNDKLKFISHSILSSFYDCVKLFFRIITIKFNVSYNICIFLINLWLCVICVNTFFVQFNSFIFSIILNISICIVRIIYFVYMNSSRFFKRFINLHCFSTNCAKRVTKLIFIWTICVSKSFFI